MPVRVLVCLGVDACVREYVALLAPHYLSESLLCCKGGWGSWVGSGSGPGQEGRHAAPLSPRPGAFPKWDTRDACLELRVGRGVGRRVAGQRWGFDPNFQWLTKHLFLVTCLHPNRTNRHANTGPAHFFQFLPSSPSQCLVPPPHSLGIGGEPFLWGLYPGTQASPRLLQQPVLSM